MKRIIVFLILICMLPITAMAKSDTITIYYLDIKVYLDDEQSDTIYDPFICEGTTYLPYQAIAYIFNLEYSQIENSIYLTSKNKPIDIVRKSQLTHNVGEAQISVESEKFSVFVNCEELESISAYDYDGNIYIPVRDVADARLWHKHRAADPGILHPGRGVNRTPRVSLHQRHGRQTEAVNLDPGPA